MAYVTPLPTTDRQSKPDNGDESSARRLAKTHKRYSFYACVIFIALTVLMMLLMAGCSIPVRVQPERTADNLIVPVPVYQVNPTPSATHGILAGYVAPERIVVQPSVGWGDWIDVALGAVGVLVPAAAGLTAMAVKLRRQFASTAIAADLADENEAVAIENAPVERREAIREKIKQNKTRAATRQTKANATKATAEARGRA